MKQKLPLLSSLVAGLVAVLAAAFIFLGQERASALPLLPPAQDIKAVHLPFGLVNPPQPMPEISLTLSDGSEAPLPAVLKGRWTLIQLMFTGCSTTCPVQGAIFTETQRLLGRNKRNVELLSVSIDTLGDTPEALGNWLQQFEAGPNWRAALPKPDGLVGLLDVLEGRSKGVDVHNARVFLINPNGALVYRTEEMPSPASLVRLIEDALKSS
jgi:protein SCO1/2